MFYEWSNKCNGAHRDTSHFLILKSFTIDSSLPLPPMLQKTSDQINLILKNQVRSILTTVGRQSEFICSMWEDTNNQVLMWQILTLITIKIPQSHYIFALLCPATAFPITKQDINKQAFLLIWQTTVCLSKLIKLYTKKGKLNLNKHD